MPERWMLRVFGVLVIAGISAGLARAKSVQVSEEDNGTRIVLNSGDTLVVRLKSNPSTGCKWTVNENAEVVLEPQGRKMEASKSGRMGAGGHQIFTFKAAGAGEGSLALTYRRPFENDSTPAKEFHLTVVVEESAKKSATTAAGSSRRVLVGEYRGVLPCGDCDGIDTDLSLYAKGPKGFVDTTFTMKMIYLGTNAMFEETGTWTVQHGTADDPKAIVYQLTPGTGTGVMNFLRTGDMELIQLDADRNPIPFNATLTLRRTER